MAIVGGGAPSVAAERPPACVATCFVRRSDGWESRVLMLAELPDHDWLAVVADAHGQGFRMIGVRPVADLVHAVVHLFGGPPHLGMEDATVGWMCEPPPLGTLWSPEPAVLAALDHASSIATIGHDSVDPTRIFVAGTVAGDLLSLCALNAAKLVATALPATVVGVAVAPGGDALAVTLPGDAAAAELATLEPASTSVDTMSMVIRKVRTRLEVQILEDQLLKDRLLEESRKDKKKTKKRSGRRRSEGRGGGSEGRASQRGGRG